MRGKEESMTIPRFLKESQLTEMGEAKGETDLEGVK